VSVGGIIQTEGFEGAERLHIGRNVKQKNYFIYQKTPSGVFCFFESYYRAPLSLAAKKVAERNRRHQARAV